MSAKPECRSPNAAIWVVLFTACVATAAIADEVPDWALTPKPQQPSAAERWQQLKANASAAAREAADMPAKPRPAPELSDDLFGDVAPGDLLPDAPTEPTWLRTIRPLTPDESDLSESEPADDRVSPAGHVSPTIIGALISLQDPRRTVRAISEIQPYYDMTVDREIREYADKQAAEYGVKFGAESYMPRAYPPMLFCWEAPNIYHYPLYFEDPQLERYGHSYPDVIQPFASIARFGTQLMMLPYQMTIDPICEPIYPLGWYRPGDCAPKLHYRIPWNTQAAVMEGLFIGLLIWIP